MKTLTIFILAALLCGCAGTHFTFDRAAMVKVGMTEAEVQKIMGKPNAVNSTADALIWAYVYADGFSGSVRSVSFGFDTNGLVASVPRIPQSFLTGNTNSIAPARSPKDAVR